MNPILEHFHQKLSQRMDAAGMTCAKVQANDETYAAVFVNKANGAAPMFVPIGVAVPEIEAASYDGATDSLVTHNAEQALETFKVGVA